MDGRRAQQQEVFALLLATTALVIPLSGAVMFGGLDAGGAQTGFVFLGAVSMHDFVPVLMVVGALGLLVAAARHPDERSALATLAAGTTVAAGATLALAYLGAAYSLRANGPFGVGDDDAAGWTTARLVTVAMMAVTGILCGWVGALAMRWIGEQRTERTR